MLDRLLTVLKARFGSAPALTEAPQGVDVLADMANRRVMRRYLDKPVDPVLLDTLCAVALSAPSKSDLQQADIVVVTDKAQRAVLDELAPGNPWMKAAPAVLVFCGNNRRQRLAFDWREPTLRQRPSRSVLQRVGRCRHRAGDLRRRGRPCRAGDLPDQHPAQQCRQGVRPSRPARPCLSGGGARRRLAVLRRRDEPPARPRRHRPSRPLRRERAEGEGRGLRQAPPRRAALRPAAPCR